MVAASLTKFRVGLKRHPVTVLVEEETGREFYTRPMVQAGGKMRPRFDLTAYLCDYVEVAALNEHDAQGIFCNAFGVEKTVADFVIEQAGAAETDRGVIHAGDPLGVAVREKPAAKPTRKRLRPLSGIKAGAGAAPVEADEEQPSRRRRGGRTE